MKISLASLMIVSVLSGTAVHAQDNCKNILQGIYDINDTSISDNTAKSANSWFCNSDSAAASGKYIEVFQGSGSWTKSRCGSNNLSEKDIRDLKQTIRSANEFIADAWSKCMARKGLQVAIIFSEEPSIFHVKFKYIPVSAKVLVASLKEGTDGFSIQGDVTCNSNWILKENREVDVSGMTFSCTRKDPSKPITVTINSDPEASDSVLNVTGFKKLTEPSVRVCIIKEAQGNSTKKWTDSTGCTTPGNPSAKINFGDDTGWINQSISISALGGKGCVQFHRSTPAKAIERCSEGGQLLTIKNIGDDTGYKNQNLRLVWSGNGKLCGRFTYQKSEKKDSGWQCSSNGNPSPWIHIGDDDNWKAQSLEISLSAS